MERIRRDDHTEWLADIRQWCEETSLYKRYRTASVRVVISKTLFFMFIRHSEGAFFVVVVARYIYTSCFT